MSRCQDGARRMIMLESTLNDILAEQRRTNELLDQMFRAICTVYGIDRSRLEPARNASSFVSECGMLVPKNVGW